MKQVFYNILVNMIYPPLPRPVILYEKTIETVMGNNYTNFNKANNDLSPQIIERQNDRDIWR